jgi:hypothetical protein
MINKPLQYDEQKNWGTLSRPRSVHVWPVQEVLHITTLRADDIGYKFVLILSSNLHPAVYFFKVSRLKCCIHYHIPHAFYVFFQSQPYDANIWRRI